jgi:hypothetical protein
MARRIIDLAALTSLSGLDLADWKFALEDSVGLVSYQLPANVLFAAIQQASLDPIVEIPLTSHGLLEATLQEAPQPIMRLPNASLVLPTFPALDNVNLQLEYFAVSVIDANTLGCYHHTATPSGWVTFPNAAFAPADYAYLQDDGTVSGSLATSARLWFTHPDDPTKLSFAYRLATAAGGTGTDTDTQTRFSQFMSSVLVPADTALDMNAPTASWTAQVAPGYTAHNARDAADFNDFYPEFLRAWIGGIAVTKPNISRNDADPAGFIRIGQPIPAATPVSFATTLKVTI